MTSPGECLDCFGGEDVCAECPAAPEPGCGLGLKILCPNPTSPCSLTECPGPLPAIANTDRQE